MILHIPHSSKMIPDDLRKQFVLSNNELERELLLMTDLYTDDLFCPVDENDIAIIYPVSRLVIDPERFLDDNQEPMSAKGMGVFYTKTSHGCDLRSDISVHVRDMLINMFYHWHHDKLTKAVLNQLRRNGKALIIDCHSFPSKPLPYESDQCPDRPDICIGTDDFHTPDGLSQACTRLFQEKDYTVSINKPFSGAIVPSVYHQKVKIVYSIMIEINRSLYMDENTGEKSSGYVKMKSDLEWILSRLTFQL